MNPLFGIESSFVFVSRHEDLGEFFCCSIVPTDDCDVIV